MSPTGPLSNTTEFEGRQSLFFSTGAGSNYIEFDDRFPTASDFTVLVVYKKKILGNTADYLLVGKGTKAFRISTTGDERISANVVDGTTTITVNTATNFVVDEGVYVALATWDETTKTLRLSTDVGVTTPYVTTNALMTSIDNDDIRIGTDLSPGTNGARSDIAEVLVYNVSLFKAANAARLATLQAYVRDAYGASL